MALLISSFLTVSTSFGQSGPPAPGRGPGGAPGSGPGSVGPGGVGPGGIGPGGVGPGRIAAPRNVAEAVDLVTRANSQLLQAYGTPGRTSALSVLGTTDFRGNFQPSREFQALKDARDAFRGYIAQAQRRGWLTIEEQNAQRAFENWDQSGRDWAQNIIDGGRPQDMKTHLLSMLDNQEVMRKAAAGTQMTRADQFEIGDRWNIHVDRPQFAGFDRDFTWGRQAPLEHAMDRLSDRTFDYLSGGFLGFTNDMDAAERQVDQVLRDYDAARPQSRRPEQLQSLLDQRARSLSNFRAQWQQFPRNPRDNDQARRHLIDALVAQDQIAEAAGARSFSQDPDNRHRNRASQIANSFGIYLPPGATSFDQAQPGSPGVGPGAGPGGAPGVGPGAGPGRGPGAGPAVGPGAGPRGPGAGGPPGAGPGAGPGRGPGAGPGRGPGAGPGGDDILGGDDIRNTDRVGPGGPP